MSRRKPSELIAIERKILEAAVAVDRDPEPRFHGYRIAKVISNGGPLALAGHGTIYKALGRLEDMGFLESEWEGSSVAELEHRPRRRLYRITAAGAFEFARAPEAVGRATSLAVQGA